MKKFFIIALTIFIPVIFACNVYAEEDTTCNYNSKAYLNKLAYNVTANYSIRQDEANQYYFNISIYNITEDIYVMLNSEKNDVVEELQILHQMTNNGTYTFRVDDITNIINYEIKIRTFKYGCTGDLRKISLIKPKRNDLSDLAICQKSELEGYKYCKEWITSYFTNTREEILESINTQYQKKTTTTTTKCVSCEVKEKNNETIVKINKIRTSLIIGLSIGTVIDGLFIIYLCIRLKRNSIW